MDFTRRAPDLAQSCVLHVFSLRNRRISSISVLFTEPTEVVPVADVSGWLAYESTGVQIGRFRSKRAKSRRFFRNSSSITLKKKSHLFGPFLMKNHRNRGKFVRRSTLWEGPNTSWITRLMNMRPRSRSRSMALVFRTFHFT